MTNIDDDIPEDINRQLDETIGVEHVKQENYTPTYRVYGESKIPVSESESKLWSIRKDQALKVMEDVKDQWEITYKYFNTDHVDIRDDGSFDYKTDTKLRNNNNCTENLVWANNIGMIPTLYSQDPAIEVTNNKDKDEELNKMSTMIERLVNVLLKRRSAPGLHIKPKARKAILNALLTNRGIIKIGYNFKIDGNENLIQEIKQLGEQLSEAKDVNEVKDIEGKIQALEETINLNTQSGPYAKHIRPFDLLIDPQALEQDGTDANWIMEREFIPTEYLKAKFGIDDEDDNTVKSIYNPDKVLPVNTKELSENDDEDNVLADENISSYQNLGYDNYENYKKSCLTECYWVWDKVKRRVYLYSNKCWNFPIWVWEDPYQLDEFFPYYVLNFHESPNASLCKGETSYYLDQQDTINMINSQLVKMREFGFNHYLYDANSGVEAKEIEKWLNGKQSVVGIRLPPNKKIDEILYAGSIPTDKNQALYDKSDLQRVVDMISGTDATTRSGEYKTNTTNLAIQSYIAGKSIRLDDKRDLIENWLGNIGWGIAQLCLQFMDIDQVSNLIGKENAQLWRNMDKNEITSTFSVQCVGGSTVKPTSDNKKQQALQIAQVLGQFASATPYVVIVMLQVLQRAIDEVVVKEEDIELIKNSILQSMQAQQQQAQQQALLDNAKAQQANAETDKNVAETAQIMSQVNGQNEIANQQTPEMLLGRE